MDKNMNLGEVMARMNAFYSYTHIRPLDALCVKVSA
jgi:hypothetical protein